MDFPARNVLDRIIACGVMPIVRMKSIDPLLDLARAILAGGLPVIEVSMGTPGALAGIERLCNALGDSMLIGVGTVLDAAMCRDAISAGAQFVVSPHFDPEIVAVTRKNSKASIPGALTPTEIVRAATAGADMVKLFPATQGGPAYLRELLAPLPFLRLMPTGGVTVGNAAEWFKAGAACVGVGSSLCSKDAIEKRDWPQVRALATAFAGAVAAARGG